MIDTNHGPLRFGLIGCGDIAAKRVASALREAEGSALVAASRARAELLPQFAKDHGVSRTYGNWRDLLRDDSVDAVYVATPVGLHAEQTIAAAESGKHVLCEKPMALDTDACDRMIAAARANNVRLGVAYYRHLYPVITRLREMLRSGELGDPVIARAEAFEAFNLAPDDPRAWFLNKSAAGGGPMADFGCHRIEVLLDLLGPLKDARGSVSNVRFKDRDVEDTCIAHLDFESGAQAVVTVSHAAYGKRDAFEVIGTRGSVQIAVLNDGLMRISVDGVAREESHPPHKNLHQPLIEDFVQAVRDGREPAISGEIGREVQRTLGLIYAAH